jgi:hypothetical protein
VPIKEIARRLGLARNTVRSALRTVEPPRRERGKRGSAVDAFEPRIRLLLAEFPTMPATVIAERIGWARSLTVLKDRVRELRPLFVAPDPADRIDYMPGELAQCDLWFPPVLVPVGGGQERVLPVLAMTCGHSRVADAVIFPVRKCPDGSDVSKHAGAGVDAVAKDLVVAECGRILVRDECHCPRGCWCVIDDKLQGGGTSLPFLAIAVQDCDPGPERVAAWRDRLGERFTVGDQRIASNDVAGRQDDCTQLVRLDCVGDGVGIDAQTSGE